MKEIKRLVMANQDNLLALHTNRDKPEIFQEVMRKIRSKGVCVQQCLDYRFEQQSSLPLYRF